MLKTRTCLYIHTNLVTQKIVGLLISHRAPLKKCYCNYYDVVQMVVLLFDMVVFLIIKAVMMHICLLKKLPVGKTMSCIENRMNLHPLISCSTFSLKSLSDEHLILIRFHLYFPTKHNNLSIYRQHMFLGKT